MVNTKLKSMTAYGRASHSNQLGRFAIEIQCLNRKFLEINLSLPKDFLRYEVEIRKWISEKISRGQVNIFLSYRPDPTHAFALVPNLPFAMNLKNAWEKIAAHLTINLNSDTLVQLISNEKDLIYTEETTQESLFSDCLKELVDQALKQVLFMKTREGQSLVNDISRRIGLLEKYIQEIAEKSPQASQKYYLKLKQRLEELFTPSMENEEKILREVAIFSEKLDISEEITRFNSHIKQFNHFLEMGTESPGKTLDFLIQELNREVNTIGSKASDASISHLVVLMKSELEKIREQVQNIE